MSQTRFQAPCGAWRSPITTDAVTASVVGLGQPLPHRRQDGALGLVWLEDRPEQAGRTALVLDGEDLLPDDFSVRSRAHEYGGGAVVSLGTDLVFSNHGDQCLYRVTPGQAPGQAPKQLTAPSQRRYADLFHDARRQRLLAVCEDHSNSGEPVTSLVALDLADGALTTLHQGHDFYSSPRLCADGSQLVFLTWDHPQMPWDGTSIHLASVADDGSLASCTHLAGGPGTSIFQPEFAPDGSLVCVADPDGWWNLHRIEADGSLVNLCPDDAEYGLPQWQFGMRTWGFAADGSIICIRSRGGRHELGRVANKQFQRWRTEWSELADLVVAGDRCWFVGSSPKRFGALVERNLATGSDRVLRRAANDRFPDDMLADPDVVHFPTADGHTGHAWFYPPSNGAYEAPAGERPPLLVMTHGGPTGCARLSFNARVQYYTSRGWAVADINYGGSTGFGRAYRERLLGQWGVVDVADCQAAVQQLARAGRIDAGRVAIRGGSAGGYTTLAALTWTDTFAAGASHYGIGDLELLASDTHKFESRYLDSMIGPLPEAADLYRQRSPIHAVDQLRCPVVFFQGEEDKVVPPNQAETMVAALRAKNIRVQHEVFPGEGHGFRKAANIRAALELEYRFFCSVFDIPLADANAGLRRVVLLAGGPSAEAEVSRASAAAVRDALASASDAGSNNLEVLLLEPDAELPAALARLQPDAVFPVLHGPPGEDGTVQGMLDILGTPYVGSGVHASACAMDKVVSKQLFRLAGLPLARDLVVQPGEPLAAAVARITDSLGEQVAVKPSRQGSALGVTLVRSAAELLPALQAAAAYGDAVLVEEFITGREMTVGVLDLEGEAAKATPVIEITTPAGSWYDYQHRYTAGLSEHLIPARLPQPVCEQLMDMALAAHRALGCVDLSRADFIVTDEHKVVLLEVNNLPGMTPLSLYPDGARALGYAFPALVRALLASAVRRGPRLARLTQRA